MSQEESHDGEQTPEHWFSHFEDECFDELEVQGRVESRLQSAEEYTAQQLWLGFQQTSTAMAQLYNFKGTHIFSTATMSSTENWEKTFSLPPKPAR